LSLLTREQLIESQLSLHLACGRSRSALKKKHRTFLCFAWRVYAAEINRRDALSA